MSDKKNPVSVRLIVSLVRCGKTIEIMNRPYSVPVELADPEAFAANCPEEYITHRGRSYQYLDCVAEQFLQDRKMQTVFHVRYILDLEMENFKTFLRSARPDHCPTNKTA